MLPNNLASLSDRPPDTENMNRYANVIPNPESRVQLTLSTKDGQTDYINANYMRVSGVDVRKVNVFWLHIFTGIPLTTVSVGLWHALTHGTNEVLYDCMMITSGLSMLSQVLHRNTSAPGGDGLRLLAHGLAGEHERHRHADSAHRKQRGT